MRQVILDELFMITMRQPHHHLGFPPQPNTYAAMLYQNIELAMQTGKQYVWQDWKQHWRVGDEKPNGDYWEINGNDVVHVSED